MDPPKRPWDPNAPSILWAHEMRRENIQLVNQIDNLRTIASTTTNTITTLRETINTLTQRITKLEEQRGIEREEFELRLKELEASNESQLATVLGRVYALEREISVGLESVKLITTRSVAQEGPERIQGTHPEQPGTDQDARSHVPDSLPMAASQSSSPPSNQRFTSERTLSETTWGSLSDLNGPYASKEAHEVSQDQLQKGDVKIPDSDIAALGSIVQGERQTLSAYLSYVNHLRERFSSIQEERFVEAFLRGLGCPGIGGHIEERLGRGGERSWESLRAIVRDIIDGCQMGGEKGNKRVDCAGTGIGADGLVAGEVVVNRKNKKRRVIPIVPVDEEDALIAASMFRPEVS